MMGPALSELHVMPSQHAARAAARIDASADIGPYCVIGPEVEIGARTRLMANIYVEGPTVIGEDNIFFPFSSVGVASQDLKYKGEPCSLTVGADCVIREGVTMNPGTEGGGSFGHSSATRTSRCVGFE